MSEPSPELNDRVQWEGNYPLCTECERVMKETMPRVWYACNTATCSIRFLVFVPERGPFWVTHAMLTYAREHGLIT